MLIDSHAHLDSERYGEDRRSMLLRAWEAGVETILSIGIGERAEGMDCAYELCRELNGIPEADDLRPGRGLPRVYASAGVYPHTTEQITEQVLARLDFLLGEPEVIACGEIGLDYYHQGAARETQRAGLIAQLQIAARRKRPIVIHCRPEGDSADQHPEAWNDLFLVLKEHWRRTGLGGVMHCFGGEWEQARQSMELGFLISFAGNLTYPKAQPLRDVAARLPLTSLLVETDAPWLAPMPDRGKRNEPSWVRRTAQTLAEVRGVSIGEIEDATTKNFIRLFGLGPDVGN